MQYGLKSPKMYGNNQLQYTPTNNNKYQRQNYRSRQNKPTDLHQKSLDANDSYSPYATNYQLDRTQRSMKHSKVYYEPMQAKDQRYHYIKTFNNGKQLRKRDHSPRLNSSGSPDNHRTKKNYEYKTYQPKHLSQIQNTISEKQDDYEKLHNKLQYLQEKISRMKIHLEKKRQQKKRFITEEQAKIQSYDYPIKIKQETNQNINQFVTQVAKRTEKESLRGLVTQAPQHKELHMLNFNPYSPRSNIYYVSEILKTYRDQMSVARQHISSSIQILQVLANSQVTSDMSNNTLKLQKRPGYQNKKTVIFDLDETLIHCNENTNVSCDVKLPIKFPTGQVVQAGINIRPYTMQILKSLQKNFEVIVFTASHSCYANAVLNYLDPEGKYIHHRLYREHCYATPEGMYVKDLRLINRCLSDIVLVDNAAYSYAYQIDNGIPILPYYQGKIDYQLKALQSYLQKLVLVKDVREINRKTFKIQQYPNYYDVDLLVKELYYEYGN